MSLMDSISPGMQRVLARSISDVPGILRNTVEGAVSGAAIGAVASRLYGDEKDVFDSKAIKDGAKLGALHGAIGKVLANIPAELQFESEYSSNPFMRLQGFKSFASAARDAGQTQEAMDKAEAVIRNVYTFNRMKTAIQEQIKSKSVNPTMNHNVRVIT